MRFSFTMICKVSLAAVFTAIMAACSSSAPTRPSPPVIAQPDYPDRGEAPSAQPDDGYRQEAERYDRRAFVRPPHMDGDEPVRVGLLLPFSADNETARRIASAMFDAAQLAVFDAGDENFLLMPKDTRGDAEGAAAAARSALADGAEIILGPLFSESVDAAAAVTRAAQVPMIAFSSDLTSAGNGVYLLSFPPESEIARIY